MKKLTCCLLLFLALGLSLSAQRQETLFGNSGLHFSGIWGSFTSNYSFFEEDQGYQPGGTIGLEFGRAIFLGYAWSRQTDELALPQLNSEFRLRQNNFILSVMPVAHQVLHPVLSIQTGGGRVSLSDGSSERILIVQPSVGMELNVFKWFHVGVDGGYRFVSDVDLPGLSREDLSSFYAQLNLRFGISWGRFK